MKQLHFNIINSIQGPEYTIFALGNIRNIMFSNFIPLLKGVFIENHTKDCIEDIEWGKIHSGLK